MNWWNTDETHNPDLQSWVESARGHADFPVQNLPFGLFSVPGGSPRIGVAIGDHVLDVSVCADQGLLPAESTAASTRTRLNDLLALPTVQRIALRKTLSRLLSEERFRADLDSALYAAADCTFHLPARIGDYTDFYVGIHHAQNVGIQFRPDNPLLPNYKHVPIGYHGRASSVRLSGEPVVRPKGQRKPPEASEPVFSPAARLDYELELGVWIGQGNALGTSIPIGEASGYIAGFCLLNDWSARDIQAWEYQPLGPFLAKNFQTTISPWIITPEALAPYRAAQPTRPEGDPRPLPYLWDDDDQQHGALGLTLEVSILTQQMRAQGLPAHRLSSGPATSMYWTINQIVTHHASNGCNLNPGDLLGTGTISAPTSDGFGSLLELSQNGRAAIPLPNGETRRFLEDGDEVILTASAEAPGRVRIGFGECRAVIAPAR